MPPRIGPKKPVRVYLSQWREHVGMTQQQVADRIEVDKGTVSRWENVKRFPSSDVLAAYAEAMNIEVPLLYRLPPDRPSLDAAIDKLPAEARKQVIEIIETFIKRASVMT